MSTSNLRRINLVLVVLNLAFVWVGPFPLVNLTSALCCAYCALIQPTRGTLREALTEPKALKGKTP